MSMTVSLLGCGAIAQEMYLSVIRRVAPRIRVSTCVDPIEANCRYLANELGARPVVGGLPECLEDPDAEGVLITVPNHLHASATIACLQAGRHVFCEKPVATSPAECDALAAALAVSGKTLSVNLLRRSYPSTLAVRRAIDAQCVGPIRTIEVSEGGRGGWKSRTGFQFNRKLSGGGVTMDRGPHIFDLLVHWFGKPEVMRYQDDAASEEACESTSCTELRWPDGKTGTVRISKCEPWGAYARMIGENGEVLWTVGDQGYATLSFQRSPAGVLDAHAWPRGGLKLCDNFDVPADLQRRWLDACAGKGPNPTPFAEIRQSIELIAECYSRREPLVHTWDEYGGR